MEKEYKHNGLCITDKLDQGWIIEGYPEPLTEAQCEKITSDLRTLEALKEEISHVIEHIEDDYKDYDGDGFNYACGLLRQKIQTMLDIGKAKK